MKKVKRIPREIFSLTTVVEASPKLLKQLVPIYRKAFKEHNIFTKKPDEVFDYLKKRHRKAWKDNGGFIVVSKDDNISGGLLMELKDKSKNHTRWQLSHVVVSKEQRNQGLGKELVTEALDKIKTSFALHKVKSCKVEVNVSEKNKTGVKFFKKLGFKPEGKLSHHYRLNEKTIVLGKLVR